MCKSSVTETPEARNRRLFLAALAAGIQVHPTSVAGVYRVDSKSGPGQHQVLVEIEGGTRLEYCGCDWGRKAGQIITAGYGTGHAIKTGRPCCHILLTRWHLMGADDRTAVCECNPDIDAAVVVAAASALVAATPIVTRPTIRRERSQEAW